MKIRPLTEDQYPKAIALLRAAFPNSRYEERLVHNLHKNKKECYEWICIHRNSVIAYICFTKAFNKDTVCGFHLAPVAVNPNFQGQGVGSELIRFALRQKKLKNETIYVLGDPFYYKRFGFELCKNPICPFDKNNKHFQAINISEEESQFTVGYEPEFTISG